METTFDLDQLFQKAELIPVIIQDASSLEVLMLGFTNREAVELTLQTKTAWFWSRSRQKLFFSLVLLAFLCLENCLWLTSYPWAGDTLANPYFWCDFAVTASLLALFPAVRKVVRT